MAVNAYDSANRTPFRDFGNTGKARNFIARWGVVLAGGEGMRMRTLITHWLGRDRPKQYCTFVGSRSMFQHTIDRACSIISENNIVTIIGADHAPFLYESSTIPIPGKVIAQPGNLGTAPGFFLATAYVLANNPEATVAFFPSDHFVYPENRFCEYIKHAFDSAEKHSDKVILIGAIPTRPETEYGWIDSGTDGIQRCGPMPYVLMNVAGFREKPTEKEAHMLLGQGCLWSTMVLAVKAKTLWALGRDYLAETMHKFDAFLSVLRAIRDRRMAPAYEVSALENIYTDLVPADFSRDILQHVSQRSMVLRMDGVNWCDWGHPQRVVETLAGLGRSPLFTAEHFPSAAYATTKESDGYTQ